MVLPLKVSIILKALTPGVGLIATEVGYYWTVFFVFILGRYFLMAGGAFWLFYSALKQHLGQRFSQRRLQWSLIRQDIKLSVLSAMIFALLAALMVGVYQAGKTRIYISVGDYGWGYLGFSFVAVLVLQDTYFYFIHRWLHQPQLFRWMHAGHHRSRTPTPWTSFAFEPMEAVIHSLFFIAVALLLPLHMGIFVAALMTMTVWAVVNHLGFELVPRQAPTRWLSQWLIGPVHHTIHHRQYRVHYGLYFTFWDRVFVTTDPAYTQNYGWPQRCSVGPKTQNSLDQSRSESNQGSESLD
ncbi:MAG: sterol desaturase family protein [Leptolyngbyaceae cyanobacterium SM2_3_12]|nr:sterol desaturase family protein [Leptolyngbyaceae cyanobacterium SM2_3_12]